MMSWRMVIKFLLLMAVGGFCAGTIYIDQRSRTSAFMDMTSTALQDYYAEHGFYPEPAKGDYLPISELANTTDLQDEGVARDPFKERLPRERSLLSSLSCSSLVILAGLVLIISYAINLIIYVVDRLRSHRSPSKEKQKYHFPSPISLVIQFLILAFLLSIAQGPPRHPGLSFWQRLEVIDNPHYLNKPKLLSYYTDGQKGFVLQSVGYDGERDFVGPVESWENGEKVRGLLAPHRYDRDAGYFSGGDLFMVHLAEDAL